MALGAALTFAGALLLPPEACELWVRGTFRAGWLGLELKVKRKGADVHARWGYYYEASR